MKRRLDQILVERGLFESRAKAQAAIAAGLVRVDGVPVAKASATVAAEADIAAQAPHPWVSRGGLKLIAALDAFGIDPAGRVCLDLGSSTGGFTQVLLSRGAARVHAVDVGRDQLHPSLRADPRVVVHEGTDARALSAREIPEPVGVVTADVSFISLRLVLPAANPFRSPGARLAALIKPQFEAGRGALGRGGLVRDPAVHEAVCAGIAEFVTGLGWRVDGIVPSPIEGGDGNREFLIGAYHDG